MQLPVAVVVSHVLSYLSLEHVARSYGRCSHSAHDHYIAFCPMARSVSVRTLVDTGVPSVLERTRQLRSLCVVDHTLDIDGTEEAKALRRIWRQNPSLVNLSLPWPIGSLWRPITHARMKNHSGIVYQRRTDKNDHFAVYQNVIAARHDSGVRLIDWDSTVVMLMADDEKLEERQGGMSVTTSPQGGTCLHCDTVYSNKLICSKVDADDELHKCGHTVLWDFATICRCKR